MSTKIKRPRPANIGSVERCKRLLSEMQRVRPLSDRDLCALRGMEQSVYANQDWAPLSTARRAQVARLYLRLCPNGEYVSDAKKYDKVSPKEQA